MRLYRRIVQRITGLFVRWGVISHPYGREYARERYTLSGRRVPESESRPEGAGFVESRPGATLVVAALLLLVSLLATGVLLAVA
ncbi:hypothetical protein [Salinigranum marinum]|uniref:hypothetical protein n=1 Tax=Salinigranum marinum TaxID=1515595 RepID=UPI002989E7B9|nr:hypothetical protein [Salinigranum marinum]